MILISGGTDGGTTTHVVQIAELIAPAKPRPRFGGEYTLPIIYAGNKDAAPLVRRRHRATAFALTVVDNLRPVLERENLGPARDAIHDLFLEHVMAHAPGYDKLMQWTDAPIMPTPGAVGNILQTIASAQRHQRRRRRHRRRDDRRLQRVRRHVQPHGQREPRHELLDLERLRRGGHAEHPALGARSTWTSASCATGSRTR